MRLLSGWVTALWLLSLCWFVYVNDWWVAAVIAVAVVFFLIVIGVSVLFAIEIAKTVDPDDH